MGKSPSTAAAIAIAAALVVVLAGDLALVVARAADGPRTGQGASPALQAALPELIGFVEEARGLRFLHPPDVELLPGDRFEALFLDDGGGAGTAADQAADDAAYVGLLRALGLVKGHPDLGAVAADAAANVVGFYDNATRVLYARGVEPTPYVKFVLVHELTHALDDQHFGLDRPDLGDDASAAFDALVEGSAVTVERRWLESRPPAEREEISTEDGGAEPGARLPGLDQRR